MKQEQLDVVKNAISHYGEKQQIDKAIEELAELQKALLKRRYHADRATDYNVLDELADVIIMCEQLKIIFHFDGQLDEQIEYKIERLKNRLEAAEYVL